MLKVNKVALNRDDDRRIAKKDGISTLTHGRRSLSWRRSTCGVLQTMGPHWWSLAGFAPLGGQRSAESYPWRNIAYLIPSIEKCLTVNIIKTMLQLKPDLDLFADRHLIITQRESEI